MGLLKKIVFSIYKTILGLVSLFFIIAVFGGIMILPVIGLHKLGGLILGVERINKVSGILTLVILSLFLAYIIFIIIKGSYEYGGEVHSGIKKYLNNN